MTTAAQDESDRLDAQVSRQIFDALVEARDDGTLIASIDPDAEETWIELPRYSVDANFALQIIPALREREIKFRGMQVDGRVFYFAFMVSRGKYYSASRESFAEALCEAGLGAVAAVSKPVSAGSWCDSLRSSA